MDRLKKIKVDVTREDISLGYQRSCYGCPIAIALNKKTKARIGIFNLIIKSDNSDLSIPLPAKLQDFVARFDRGEIVDPFSFEIHLPTSYIK